jgi:hypothetical protein
MDDALDELLLNLGDLDALWGPLPEGEPVVLLPTAPTQQPVYSAPNYAQAQQPWAYQQAQAQQQAAPAVQQIPAQAPLPRKRGRPKGSGANVNPQVLQEQLEKKLAELEHLRKVSLCSVRGVRSALYALGQLAAPWCVLVPAGERDSVAQEDDVRDGVWDHCSGNCVERCAQHAKRLGPAASSTRYAAGTHSACGARVSHTAAVCTEC